MQDPSVTDLKAALLTGVRDLLALADHLGEQDVGACLDRARVFLEEGANSLVSDLSVKAFAIH